MGELDLIHLNGHWRFWLKAKQTGFLMAVWKTLLSPHPLLSCSFFLCSYMSEGWQMSRAAQHKQPKGLRDFWWLEGVKRGRNTCFDWPKDARAALGWQLHSKVNRGGHSSLLWSRVAGMFSAFSKAVELFQMSLWPNHRGDFQSVLSV